MAEELKEEVSASDLPLSANLHDITVKHFVLDLSCDLAQHMFEGSIVLWCLPSQTSKETGTEKKIKDDSAAVQGPEKTDASVGKSSEISSDNLRVCCHTERTVRDEDNVDRHLEMLGQSVDVEADNQASPASVVCVQSSPSVGGCCQVPVKSTHQTESLQRGEMNCCVERISDSAEPASPARNCCCGCDCCLSCERHLSDSDAVICLKCSGYSLKTKSQGQKTVDEKNTQKRGFCTSFECSSSQNPDFVTLDKKCCCKCSENSNCLVTNVTDTPGCLKSNSECDTGMAGLVQEQPEEETITRHSVSKNTSFSECPEALNQTAELSRCSKADTAVTPMATHEMKEVAPPHVSQSVSSLCPHTNSSISNKKSVSCGEPFKMILDSFKLDIQRVEGIYLQDWEKLQFEQHPDKFVQQMINKDSVSASKQHRCQMQFRVKEHCLHVFVEGVDSPRQFPQAVQIWYRTDPTGPSLKWTKDQDDQPCVFTPGHFLSNRSLLPSQDFPTALPTWEASITVDAGLTVLLTGDLDPAVSLTHGRRKFSFFTHFPMPSSTFAIAVGSWEMETLQYGSLLEDVLYKDVHKPPVRLFFPRRLKEKSLSVLGDYLPRCMVEVQRMLGTYPFHRLDVLFVPACFDSLGMASPSLLFLSQSTLGGGGSMCVRVAHELCHTWFGLVMGPQDWTEEWMTEGFCTYLEDVLHAQVTQLGESTEDYLGLRAELHLRVLKAELDNTDEDLQSLRPNKGKETPQPSGEETTFLKNGMNAEKKFMQVHYLKGYFLLHALEREVGREPFLSFLRDYVRRYLYQLVTSQEFLEMFFSAFTDLKHISVESINADWLDCPGMPKKPMYMYGVDKEKGVTDKENALSMQIQQQLASIVKICRLPQRKRRHSGQMRRNQQLPELGQMLTPQVVVLLDRLLDEKLVPGHVLDLLRSSYHLHLENPEVCHRWCELVIKHRHKKWHCDVQHFLIQHQAMGVYLYGEASISRCPDVVHLARSCFRQLQHDMPESVRDTVSAMLYGT